MLCTWLLQSRVSESALASVSLFLLCPVELLLKVPLSGIDIFSP